MMNYKYKIVYYSVLDRFLVFVDSSSRNVPSRADELNDEFEKEACKYVRLVTQSLLSSLPILKVFKTKLAFNCATQKTA